MMPAVSKHHQPKKAHGCPQIQLLLNQLTNPFAPTPRIERSPPSLRPSLLLTDGLRDVIPADTFAKSRDKPWSGFRVPQISSPE